jgi:protein-tyrosine phosphatase
MNSFDRVAPHLFIGKRPPPDHKLGLAFDWIVLCAYEIQKRSGEFGRAHVIHAPMDDTEGKPPTAHEKHLARETSETAAKLASEGKDILFTCAQGRNRSAWVAARTMVRLGYKPQQAIDIIRSKRKNALTNEYFVQDILQAGGERGLSRRPASAHGR